MAVSHKDWELPYSRIWLAEINIESGLDFSISGLASRPVMFCNAKVADFNAKILTIFFSLTIFIYGSAKKSDKERKEK